MKTQLTAILLLAAVLAGCSTTDSSRTDPEETLANLEKEESMDHVLVASKIGKAAIQYERAFGKWPRSPRALGKKLSEPIDFEAFEDLRFKAISEDLFTITFKFYGADFSIENEANNSPLSESERSKYKEKSYKIEIE